MRTTTFISILFLLFFFSSNLFAQKHPRTTNLGKEQVKIKKTILHGIKTGELTRGEVKMLAKKSKMLKKHIKKAKMDGIITTKEKRRLNKESNRLKKQIFLQKHDAQKRVKAS
ncbi:hypothetical protein ACFLS9_05315 [Bacteroidota bacterium]